MVTISKSIVSPESCRVASDIVEGFDTWARERIADYEDSSFARTPVNQAKIDTLIFAQLNLHWIVAEVTGVHSNPELLKKEV